MFDIGFLEVVIILVLSLLVLGPERLPKAARTVGYWFGKARRYVEGMKSQVEAEFDSTEVKRLLRNQEVQIRELQNKLQNGEEYINNEYHNQFDNRDDPGTYNPPLENSAAEDQPGQGEQKKRPVAQYEMIEEDDERWHELKESNTGKSAETDSQSHTSSLEERQPEESSVAVTGKSQ